jgi:hypothetical protein
MNMCEHFMTVDHIPLTVVTIGRDPHFSLTDIQGIVFPMQKKIS